MADGWVKTSKQDDNGHYYYALKQKKQVNPLGETEYFYYDRAGKVIIRVTRTDDGDGNKDVFQNYFDGQIWHKTLKKCDPTQVPIYRYTEIRSAIASGKKFIFIVEGEKCADRMWELGLPATTTKQGLAKWLDEHTQDLDGAKKIVLVPDRDRPGLRKIKKIAKKLSEAGIKPAWLYAPPNDFIWKDLPDKNGSDIADWIYNGVTATDLVAAIRYEPLDFEASVDPETNNAETEENFTQRAYQALYSKHNYIAIAGELYRWNGNYYERVLESQEKRRIAMWCQSTPIAKRGGGFRYGLASTSKVEEIYKWALLLNGVDPIQVNPPGINCKNGVVEIVWQGKIPEIKLSKPDPSRYYTYCSEIEYNPNASTEHCDKLLAALDPPQREIFLKTIAVSFDLTRVRKYHSGNIKALLLQGTGSNGKDSLWQAVHSIVGETMTQISFSDFQEYDKGRKFNVARLESAKICWASENSEYISLDNVQVLKQAITGEKIAIEQKNAPAYLMDVNAVFLFNVNQAPLITAGLEAISRRYAVLDFNKTYRKDANPALGQIEADPRFRYDMEFLNTQVAPALLNYLLAALKDVMTEGIDYSCTEQSLDRIKKSSNHLWEFVEDVGLVPDPNGQVRLKDIWELLEQWYIDNEILEITNGQKYWSQPVRKGDEYVKASRSLFSKLKDIFPHIENVKSTTKGLKNKAFITGIVKSDAVRQKVRLEALQDIVVRQVEANQGNYSLVRDIKYRMENLTENQALELQDYLQEVIFDLRTKNTAENSKNYPDSNIVNLPNFASPPPPLYVSA